MSAVEDRPLTAGETDGGNGQPSYNELRNMTEQARVREGIKPYSEGKRFGYGLLWAFWSVMFAIAAISLLGKGSVGAGLLALVLAAVAVRYDYRIWTYQARRLIFLLIW